MWRRLLCVTLMFLFWHSSAVVAWSKNYRARRKPPPVSQRTLFNYLVHDGFAPDLSLIRCLFSTDPAIGCAGLGIPSWQNIFGTLDVFESSNGDVSNFVSVNAFNQLKNNGTKIAVGGEIVVQLAQPCSDLDAKVQAIESAVDQIEASMSPGRFVTYFTWDEPLFLGMNQCQPSQSVPVIVSEVKNFIASLNAWRAGQGKPAIQYITWEPDTADVNSHIASYLDALMTGTDAVQLAAFFHDVGPCYDGAGAYNWGRIDHMRDVVSSHHIPTQGIAVSWDTPGDCANTCANATDDACLEKNMIANAKAIHKHWKNFTYTLVNATWMNNGHQKAVPGSQNGTWTNTVEKTCGASPGNC